MSTMLYVGLGGALGSMARYVMVSWVARTISITFPYGTMMVNILGSFLMGVLVGGAMLVTPEKATSLYGFLAVGVLGGFTTFSAFSYDAMMLIERGAFASAAFYVIASIAFSFLALFVGVYLVRAIAA